MEIVPEENHDCGCDVEGDSLFKANYEMIGGDLYNNNNKRKILTKDWEDCQKICQLDIE